MSMNELSDDIKKKFILPLTTELPDHKEKVFHNTPVFPILSAISLLGKKLYTMKTFNSN